MTGLAIQNLTGAQAVARAAHLLKLVGERTTHGKTMTDLIADTGLKRPTVHRLLSALQAEGLIEQDLETRKWHLGAETYVLGTLAAARFNIESLAHDSLIRIADESGESAFLSIRRGNEAVCLVREEGSFPIRTHVLQPGDRNPLGVGAAGLAMLAACSDEQISRSLGVNQEIMRKRFPKFTSELIQNQIKDTRRANYAVNPGLLFNGSWGIAVAVMSSTNEPIAALSITAIEARLQKERQVALGILLKREAEHLQLLLNSTGNHLGEKRRVA